MSTLLTLAWVAWTLMVQQAWLNLADALLAGATILHRRGLTGDRLVHAVALCYCRADCPHSARAVRGALGGVR